MTISIQGSQHFSNQPVIASTVAIPMTPAPFGVLSAYYTPATSGTVVFSNSGPISFGTNIVYSGRPITASWMPSYGSFADPPKVGDSVKSNRPINKRVIVGVVAKIYASKKLYRDRIVVEDAVTGKLHRAFPTDFTRVSPLDVLVAIEASKGKTLCEAIEP